MGKHSSIEPLTFGAAVREIHAEAARTYGYRCAVRNGACAYEGKHRA